MGRITKSDLIAAVASDQDLPQSTVRRVLECTLERIGGSVMGDGDTVQLPGFGSFVPKDRAERNTRNPRTGAMMRAPASRSIGFRASKSKVET